MHRFKSVGTIMLRERYEAPFNIRLKRSSYRANRLFTLIKVKSVRLRKVLNKGFQKQKIHFKTENNYSFLFYFY